MTEKTAANLMDDARGLGGWTEATALRVALEFIDDVRCGVRRPDGFSRYLSDRVVAEDAAYDDRYGDA